MTSPRLPEALHQGSGVVLQQLHHVQRYRLLLPMYISVSTRDLLKLAHTFGLRSLRHLGDGTRALCLSPPWSS